METALNDSAFLQRLEVDAGRTNRDILSDQERTQAKVVLSNIQGELALRHSEIMRLVAEHRGIAGRLSRVQIALAPHKRLPLEVLAEIFACAASTDSINFPTKPEQLPWTLCKVSWTWRRVALKEPRLWNRIVVTDNHNVDPNRLASMVNSVIPSTGLLSITLNHLSQSASATSVNDIIISNLSRVKELNMKIAASEFPRLFDASLDSLFSLESLILHLWNLDTIDDWNALTHQFSNAVVFRHAAKLKTLELHSTGQFKLPRVIMSLPIPWNQLISLCLTELWPLTLMDVHRVLIDCFRLENLRVAFTYNSDSDMTSIGAQERLNLPNLHAVELRGIRYLDLLMEFTIPWGQLTALCLPDFDGAAQGSALFPILRQCVRMHVLTLFCSSTPTPHLAEAIVLPRLTHLVLYIERTLFLDQLIVPALVSLAINTKALPFPATDISSMIKRSGCSLSTLNYHGKPQCDDYAALRTLLTQIPSVETLMVSDLVLDGATIQSIASGESLPRLATLSCQLQRDTLWQFVDLLERRVQEGGVAGARSAIMRYAQGYIKMVATDPTLLEAVKKRMDWLNHTFGTHFSIHLT